MAKALRAAGARTVVYLRDVEFHELGADPAELPGLRYIANSRFVAEKFRAAYGPEPEVLRPLFRAERYRTPREPREVTFVNRSEEHTSELQSLMRTSYAVFCLKKKKK